MRKGLLVLSILSCVALASPALAASPPLLVGHAAKAGGTILNVPIPADLLAIPLINAEGKTFTLASLKGKTVVMTDFLTLCNETCPMTSINMREIGDAVTKAKLNGSLQSLELTIDPKRDTPKRLKSYQSLFSDPSWTVATGSVKGIKTLWAWFGVYTQVVPGKTGVMDWMNGKQIAYDVNHDDVIVIIGPDLHWRWLDLGTPAVTNTKVKNIIPAKIYNYLSPTGKSIFVKPEQPFWSTSAVYGALNEIFKINIAK